jgi:hypothetical protein
MADARHSARAMAVAAGFIMIRLLQVRWLVDGPQLHPGAGNVLIQDKIRMRRRCGFTHAAPMALPAMK